jgi:hypothetical protein
MALSKELREQVLSRAEGYCEFCGNGLPEVFALHHRKLKSRGGKDTVDNLIAVHHSCHNGSTNAIHFNVALSESTGHIVPTHADPSEYPLTLANGSTVTLTTEGTYNYLERKEGYGW